MAVPRGDTELFDENASEYPEDGMVSVWTEAVLRKGGFGGQAAMHPLRLYLGARSYNKHQRRILQIHQGILDFMSGAYRVCD